MPLQDRQQLQQLLDTMRRPGAAGGRVDACRRLFAQLNYRATRKPLPIKLPREISGQIAGPPTIIATAGQDASFLIVHVQLAHPSLPRVTERAIVQATLKDHPYALFVFSNADQSLWHLLNVKIARREISDDNRDIKLRRLFRRITIGTGDRLRTAVERIEKLDLAAIDPNLSDISPLAIQRAHDEAFDVEAVTREFFKEYKRVFEQVEDAITGIRGPDKRRMFTQRLFNRLMFIAFIQRKGWLKYAGMEDNEYIEALWKDYQHKKKDDSNFYTDRLAHLFFRGLNNSAHVDLLATNRGHSLPPSFLQRRIGDVPYLNGGLFEKSDDGADEADAGIAIPDKAIDAVVHQLFARFNFTVTESTPLDVEVAVDPEMLGKVFEELVTGRHESGSYYTPKAIVSFMCREALKGYLEAKCPKEKADAIARFVDQHDASGVSNGEAVLDALKAMKCCDPACGSGAYLLGMMHELLDLRQTLFKTNQKLDPVNIYERKLEIIQTNVYGVDLDPFAINIARLRLWLSLVVEFDWENGKHQIPALPNLDFKIEAGDSLSAPDPSGGFDPGLNRLVMEEFIATKREHATALPAEKKRLMRRALELRENLRLWYRGKGAVHGFDWPVEFPEVFEKGGFDAILANPPYVRQELIKEQKPMLKAVYGPLFSGTADLYVFFYLRALQLLNKGGTLAFISSNKWFRAGYGEKLRALIARTISVHTILDFHDLPVFESAIAYPMIFIAAKTTPSPAHQATVAEPPSLEPPYPDVTAVVAEFGRALGRSGLGTDGEWQLSSSGIANRLSKMRDSGQRLAEIIGNRFYRGVVTGLNDAFYIDERKANQWLQRSKVNERFIKRAIHGEHARRYSLHDSGICLLRIPDGTTLQLLGHDLDQISHSERAALVQRVAPKAWKAFRDHVPDIANHLADFKEAASSRDDRGDFWWELRPCDYYSIFAESKIVFPQTGKRGRFTIDATGVDLDQTVYTIVSSDLFLLALCNCLPCCCIFRVVRISRSW